MNSNQFIHQIKIYQIKDVEKTMYAFREYDEKLFSMDDYEEVLSETYSTHLDGENIFEIYHMLGNNGVLQSRTDKKMHSLSVSDIIEVDGTKYYIQNIGYKEIK